LGATLVPTALAVSPEIAAGTAGASGAAGRTPGGDMAGRRPMPVPLRTHLDHWSPISDVFERPGNLIRGVYHHTAFPRWDLHVVSQGVRIKPGLALGAHASFVAYNDGETMLMGDLVVPESRLQQFLDDLMVAGIMVTAVHKHLLTHAPGVWWVHVCAASRNPLKLARGLHTALVRSGTPGPPPAPAHERLDIDGPGIDDALGVRGKANGDVYTTVFVRRESVADMGRLLPSGLGATTAINFQPLRDGRAAVSGDFSMTASEVPRALRALRRAGLDIVSLHNHGLTDEPRLFFTHFWAVDDAVRIAQAVHEALVLTNVRPAHTSVASSA